MSIICQALEGLQLTEDFCANFAKTLKFSYSYMVTPVHRYLLLHTCTAQSSNL